MEFSYIPPTFSTGNLNEKKQGQLALEIKSSRMQVPHTSPRARLESTSSSEVSLRIARLFRGLWEGSTGISTR